MGNAILLISCPDQKGITAAVTDFIFKHNGNIVSADQHIDEQTNTFFMRIEWSVNGFALEQDQIHPAFSLLAEKFQMQWSIDFSKNLSNVAIFVSRHLHCLYDLLLRHQEGQLNCRIPVIISNHSEAGKVAGQFGIKFFECEIDSQNKIAQEKKQLAILREEGIDLIILARYQQILTEQLIHAFPQNIINIHHSFLPAFVGGNPYRQAYQKGVKIIGATSHYVIEELDAGPIIDQDTVRVTHRDRLEDLIRKGQDLEKVVLSRAVRWHLQKKILCYNNKTVVFD
jgi:formyltetrahydrofolate deformylase